jgi:hypothetical protein
VEIYKESMIDLLSNLSDDNKSSNQLTVVEEKNGNYKNLMGRSYICKRAEYSIGYL